ncbi:hypothetical protein MAPG_06437 [Magnaporthiopsis poae ATCC 64411]|uniref:Uncharacterized protein n=1 Tax=Magnaporthiopsis poae (strain ATCC 64411 / 73-15) TaxID=644358 RepID=A0A0C4E211_MAGP6|nr:hypothetical protein MAPG_06437 [Magnaporthiopsis poae ATCC 64411]
MSRFPSAGASFLGSGETDDAAQRLCLGSAGLLWYPFHQAKTHAPPPFSQPASQPDSHWQEKRLRRVPSPWLQVAAAGTSGRGRATPDGGQSLAAQIPASGGGLAGQGPARPVFARPDVRVVECRAGVDPF